MKIALLLTPSPLTPPLLLRTRYGAKLMRDLGSFDGATAMDAAETTARDLNQSAGSGLIVVSQSGETKDVRSALTNNNQ